MKMKKLTLLFALVLNIAIFAQTDVKKDTISNYSKILRNTSFSWILQTRYSVSLTDNVDVTGTNAADKDKLASNSFNLR